jgi:zinc transporter 1/2/3
LAGILLGTGFAVVFSGGGEVIAEAIFDGIAAGTFIYIAVLDIIGDVFEDKKDPWLRFGLVVSGFSLMGLIAIWA